MTEKRILEDTMVAAFVAAPEDESLVAKYVGGGDVNDYVEGCSCVGFLAGCVAANIEMERTDKGDESGWFLTDKEVNAHIRNAAKAEGTDTVNALVAAQALPFAPEANLVWFTPRKLARLLWAADGKTEAA